MYGESVAHTMTETQLTLVQIDNYGPWTVTPEPRPEMDLQVLQSRLFADVADFVGGRDGYAFSTRLDNVVAVTNGMDRRAHERLQASVGNRYPVTVSVGVGVDETPAAALGDATEQLQAAGSAQDGDRREVLGFAADPPPVGTAEVEMAHFDVDDVTGDYTDRLNAYDSFLAVERALVSLMGHLREEHGALAFFVGGDNVIAAMPDLSTAAYRAALDHVADETGVPLKVGVGQGATAADAGMTAKHALERCRGNGTAVEVGHGHPESAADD
jgi:GTP cyclohydrolase IIa